MSRSWDRPRGVWVETRPLRAPDAGGESLWSLLHEWAVWHTIAYVTALYWLPWGGATLVGAISVGLFVGYVASREPRD